MASRPNNGTEPNPDVRDTIFICHASPDDNDFVRWLGTRLTGHGYKVWADLFELKGGSPFWSTIEEALRHHACKMIFVVSHSSADPNRTGVLNELSVADSIKKRVEDDGFIIPVKIDDTAYSEFPIQIHRLNAIDFSKGWGPKFIELLDALESAAVIKTDGDQTAEFEKWRATMVRTSTIVEAIPERVVTNRVPVIKFPATISFYEYDGDNTKIATALSDTGIPHAMYGRLIITFAEMSALQQHLLPAFTLKPRTHASFEEFINGLEDGTFAPTRDEAQKIVIALLREHLERYLQLRGLKKSTSCASVNVIPDNRHQMLPIAPSTAPAAIQFGNNEKLSP
jgi:TIR domain